MSAGSPKKYLPVEEWPEADRLLWERACSPADYFSNAGLDTKWTNFTRCNAEIAYGSYLLHLRDRARLFPLEQVRERFNVDDLRAFVEHLTSRYAPNTVLSIIRRLSQLFRAMEPAADRSALQLAISRLGSKAKNIRDIDGHLLQPDELVRIGEQMMEEAERSAARELDRPIVYRDGLMIKFFALCPIRRANMQQICLGENLTFEDDRARLRFAVEDMKGRREYDVPLPPELVRHIHRYVDHYRPILLARCRHDTAALWLTIWGTVMVADRIYLRITANLLARTGKWFTPHMFRHACATFIADLAPERSQMAASVLHHRNFRTTRKHYVRGQQHRAVRRYQSAIRELASKAGRSKKKRGK